MLSTATEPLKATKPAQHAHHGSLYAAPDLDIDPERYIHPTGRILRIPLTLRLTTIWRQPRGPAAALREFMAVHGGIPVPFTDDTLGDICAFDTKIQLHAYVAPAAKWASCELVAAAMRARDEYGLLPPAAPIEPDVESLVKDFHPLVILLLALAYLFLCAGLVWIAIVVIPAVVPHYGRLLLAHGSRLSLTYGPRLAPAYFS